MKLEQHEKKNKVKDVFKILSRPDESHPSYVEIETFARQTGSKSKFPEIRHHIDNCEECDEIYQTCIATDPFVNDANPESSWARLWSNFSNIC